MAEQSFTSAVEKALKRGQLSPSEAAAAKQLPQLSPKERALKRSLDLKKAVSGSNKAGAKLPTTAASARAARKGLSGTVGKISGKGLAPLAAAEQAYQAGMLVLSQNARDEAAQGYEDMADDNAIARTIRGGLGGVTTIYGAGKALADMDATNSRAQKSMSELIKKEADPKNQKLVVDAKERQAIYMSLPKEEQDKIDSMSGKDAKQYLMDKQNAGAPEPKSAPAPAPSPATTSTPKSSESYFSKPEGKPTEIDRALIEGVGKRIVEMEGDNIPKAIPVAEPAKVDMERALALFQNTHGGPFDPKSSMDKDKMAAIQSLMAQKGSEKLTPNQFSLQIYRQSK